MGTINRPSEIPRSMVIASPNGTRRTVQVRLRSPQKIAKIAMMRIVLTSRSKIIFATELAMKASGGTLSFMKTALPPLKPAWGVPKAAVKVPQMICPIMTKAG